MNNTIRMMFEWKQDDERELIEIDTVGDEDSGGATSAAGYAIAKAAAIMPRTLCVLASAVATVIDHELVTCNTPHKTENEAFVIAARNLVAAWEKFDKELCK